jgi:hypothetical protein
MDVFVWMLQVLLALTAACEIAAVDPARAVWPPLVSAGPLP